MKKINFKLLLGSLIASAFMILISNLMAFAIFSVPEILEAFNNFFGYNIENYTFDITINLIVSGLLTILIYYLMGE